MEKKYNAIIELKHSTVELTAVPKEEILRVIKREVEVNKDTLVYLKWEPSKNV